jgi:hypothetical protein
MDTAPASRRQTVDRYNRRNRLKAKNRTRGPQHYCGTPEGRAAIDLFLGPAVAFMAGQSEMKPPEPPAGLGAIVNQLDPYTLAAAILVPLEGDHARLGRRQGRANARVPATGQIPVRSPGTTVK